MSDLTGEVFLTITQSGNRAFVTKATQNLPRLAAGERAIRLRLSVPADLFRAPPVPTVEIAIDPDRVAVGRATVEVLDEVMGR